MRTGVKDRYNGIVTRDKLCLGIGLRLGMWIVTILIVYYLTLYTLRLIQHNLSI